MNNQKDKVENIYFLFTMLFSLSVLIECDVVLFLIVFCLEIAAPETLVLFELIFELEFDGGFVSEEIFNPFVSLYNFKSVL